MNWQANHRIGSKQHTLLFSSMATIWFGLGSFKNWIIIEEQHCGLNTWQEAFSFPLIIKGSLSNHHSWSHKHPFPLACPLLHRWRTLPSALSFGCWRSTLLLSSTGTRKRARRGTTSVFFRRPRIRFACESHRRLFQWTLPLCNSILPKLCSIMHK